MPVRFRGKKKSVSTRSGDEKDRLVAELKDRVTVLENELRFRQSDTISREAAGREPIEEYLALFRRMVDRAADMVFLLGPMGRIQYANEAACKALGYTQEELQSMTVFEINQKHNTDNWQEHEAALKRQGSITFENVLKTKDGRLIPVENSANYARLGDTEYNYSFVRDITERKRAEEVLRESEASRKVAEAVEAERKRLFDVLEGLPAMVCLLTQDYHVAFANRSFREKFGESHGRHCYDYCFGLTGPCRFCEAYSVLETGRPHHWEVTALDGSVVDVYDFPFTDADGTPMVLEMDIDITERRRAEEALRKNKEMLSSIIESSPVPMVLYNEEEKIYLYNKKFTETFGYTAEDVPTINEWWTLAYPDEKYRESIKNKWYDAVDPAVKNKASIAPQEAAVTAKDGSKRYVLGELSSIGSMNLAVLYDITDRKRAEEALKDSEEKFRALAEASPAIILFHQGGKHLYVNAATEAITGYSHDELLNMDYWEFIAPEHRDTVKARGLARLLGENPTSTYPVKILTKQGGEKWIEISASRMEYHGQPAIMVTALDITERKWAEVERERLLRDVEEQRVRLQAILDAIPVGVWVADAMGKLITINDAAVNIWGGRPSEVNRVGEYFVYKIWRPDTDDRVPEGDYPIARALRGETVKGMVIDFERFDGTHGTQLASSAPIKDPRGNIIGGVAVALDITTLKRTEEDLKTAKAQAELYLDLMGHDINNMHQVALGYLELARDLPAGNEPAAYMDKAVEVLQRSTQLIGNVRKLQKLQDGVFRAREVDLCRLLADVQNEYGAVPGKTIKLHLNGHGRCPVRANELLHDVFANLVGNAVKHTGDGTEIVVSLDTKEDNGGRFYRVAVEDTGPGIPDDSKERIFNRMHKGSVRGMGLGLYLVKTLVNSYGGRVWAEDRVKGDHTQGARFVVLLPAV